MHGRGRWSWIVAACVVALVLVAGAPAPSPTAPPIARAADAKLRWNLERIAVERAWAITRGSPNVVIGIVDSGLDARHPELAGRVAPGRDFTGGNNTSDSGEHGTFVAGIAAGAGIESAGVAPGARVMPLKVFGRGDTFSALWVAEAIRYSVNNGARVLNLSLRLSRESQELKEAIDYAHARGVLVVCSAGNQGSYAEGAPVQYPANHPRAFAVTSTTWDDKRANYASIAPWVRIAAPGGDYSTGTGMDPKLLIYGPVPGGKYAHLQGTSFAAPHVAGLAALIWSANPDLGVDEVMQIITRSADPMGGPERPNPAYGWGRINAGRAVRAALPRDLRVEAFPPPAPEAATVRGWVVDRRNPDLPIDDLIEAVELWSGPEPGSGRRLGEARAGAPLDPAAPPAAAAFSFDLDSDLLGTGETPLWVVARTVLGDTAWTRLDLAR